VGVTDDLVVVDNIAKMEDENLPIPQVDTIVSEPIGVLLFHERMVSSTTKNQRED
jgi:histone-arginine methyltransferase CARM1